MVDWLAGNRVRGTSTERTTSAGFNDVTITGGWKEVGRYTLPSASSTITVSSLPDKKYYMILCPLIADSAGGTDSNWRFNGSTSGYNWRYYYEGQTADSTATNQTKIFDNGSGGSRLQFSVSYIANVAGKEKLMIIKNALNWTSGASGSITRKNIYGKWTNTDVINSIQLYCSDGGGQTGDEVVVLGWDEDDTHTTNFWEELASADWSSGTSISSGTITAKKYLWVQWWIKGSHADLNGLFTFNSDTDSNYNNRKSSNGGADSTGQRSNIDTGNQNSDGMEFGNMFIINNSANEKLCIWHTTARSTAGAGNYPNRKEGVGKWANTSAQITDININGNSTLTDGGIKVWGSN